MHRAPNRQVEGGFPGPSLLGISPCFFLPLATAGSAVFFFVCLCFFVVGGGGQVASAYLLFNQLLIVLTDRILLHIETMIETIACWYV